MHTRSWNNASRGLWVEKAQTTWRWITARVSGSGRTLGHPSSMLEVCKWNQAFMFNGAYYLWEEEHYRVCHGSTLLGVNYLSRASNVADFAWGGLLIRATAQDCLLIVCRSKWSCQQLDGNSVLVTEFPWRRKFLRSRNQTNLNAD